MITWQTTVAPDTSFSSVNGGTVTQRNNPGAGSTTTDTFTFGTTIVRNWSRSATTISSAAAPVGALFSTSSVSVLGTVNSTDSNSFTRLSTVGLTTTQTTRAYTFQETGLKAFTRAIPSSTTATSVFGNQTNTVTTSTFATQATSSLGTISTVSAVENAITTIIGAPTIATPIFATVVVAERNEVIFAAETTAASDSSSVFAPATDAATTFTRITVMPWTQTTTFYEAAESESTATSFPAETYSMTLGRTTDASTQITTVNFFELPNKTNTVQATTGTTESYPATFTVYPQTNLTLRKSQFTTTDIVQSTITVPAEAYGLSFESSFLAYTTASRLTTLGTARTETESYSEDGLTRTEETSIEITSFAPIPHRIGIFQPRNISQSYNFFSGAYDDGAIAGWFTCDEEIGAGAILPSISRGVRSVLPTTFVYSSSFAVTFEDEEEPGVDYEQAGSATISGLSVTILPQDSDNTSQTFDSSSFELSAEGQALQTHLPADQIVQGRNDETRFGYDLQNLGASETFFQTIGPGVYKTSGQTFSTTWEFSSFVSGGSSREWIEPLSYLGPSNQKIGADLLTWSGLQNAHPDSSILTVGSNYGATRL